jgi:hypothetical protein
VPDPSSGQAFAFLTGLLAVALGLALLGKRPGLWLALAAGLLPAALLVLIPLTSRDRLGDLQLNLTEIHFAAEAPFETAGVNAAAGRHISIGSNSDGSPAAAAAGAGASAGAGPADPPGAASPDPLRSDDIVVRGRANATVDFGPGFAGIDLNRSPDPLCSGRRLCLRFDAAARARGVIAVGEPLGWPAADRFGGAARYCVGGHSIGLDPAANRLVVDGRPAAASLPPPEPKRVVLFRDFGIVDPGVGPDDQPLRGIESYLVGDGEAYRLIVADAAGRLAPAGGCRGGPVAARALGAGLPDRTTLWIYSLEPPSAADYLNRLRKSGQGNASTWARFLKWLGYGSDDLPRARLVLRRSLALQSGADGLTVIPATPDTLRIPYAGKDRQKIDSVGGGLISFGNLGPLLQGSNVRELHFASVGARIRGQFRQILDLRNEPEGAAGCRPGLTGGLIERPGGAEPPAETATGMAGAWLRGLAFGCEMFLGSASGDWVRVEQNRLGFDYLPFGLAAALAPLGLLLGLFASLPLRRSRSLAFAALILLDFMLALRQLVAFEAAYVDPRPSVVFSMLGATVAIWTLPPVALALAGTLQRGAVQAGRGQRWAGRISILGALLLAGYMWAWAPASMPGSYLYLACLAPAGLLALLLLKILRPILAKYRRPEASADPVEAVRTEPDCDDRDPIDPQSEEPPQLPGRLQGSWAWLRSNPLGLFAVLAVSCWLAGTAMPRMMAATMFLLLAFGVTARFAITWVGRAGSGPGSGTGAGRLKAGAWRLFRILAVSSLLLLPLLVTAPAALAQSDSGFGFLNWMALAMTWLVLWVTLRLDGRQDRGGLLPAMLVWPVLSVLILMWLAVWAPLTVAEEKLQPTRTEIARTLDAVVDSNHFTQRWLAFSNPDMLDALGTRESEGARSAFYQMAVYANQGNWGRGYFNQPPPTELRLAHTSDYAAAVHLITPFGRIGSALFLIVTFLTIAHVAAEGLRRRSLARLPTLLALGGLCLLFFGDFYMILANMLAVPFTGRNVYFLSPISISDLVESLALILPAIFLALSNEPAPTEGEPAA